jgi:aspartokinase/homoserine dehydrogenase 1
VENDRKQAILGKRKGRKMTTLTMKFGGTSIGSVDALTQVADIVLKHAQEWDRMAVVVSAISGVTNALTQGAHTAASGDDQTYQALYSDLKDRHHHVVNELLYQKGERVALQATVDKYLDEFAALCHSVYILGRWTRSPR